MSYRILVVDDEAYVRDMLNRVLRRGEHQVQLVATAEDALRSLSTETFDVVITDVVMPGMGGFELLRRVKAMRPDVKVLVLTGYARKQSISDFLLYGADGYLSKPFQVDALLREVARVAGAGDDAPASTAV